MTDIILSTQNGEPVASSRQIAESFGKEHKHVLDSIKNLVAENSAAKSMFYETTFETKETTVVHSDGHTSINKTPKVTGKGQIYFVNLFLKGRDPAGRLREGGQHQRKEVEA